MDRTICILLALGFLVGAAPMAVADPIEDLDLERLPSPNDLKVCHPGVAYQSQNQTHWVVHPGCVIVT